MIKEKRNQGAVGLLVDNGNFVRGKSPTNMLKAEYLAKAMVQMGYDAVNLSREEIMMGTDEMLQFQVRERLPLVSSNLLWRQGDRFLVSAHLIKRVGASRFLGFEYGGTKVAILGLATPEEKDLMSRPVPKELRLGEPDEMLATALKKLRRHCDLVIVLSDLNLDLAKEVASAVKGIDLFFIGSGAMAKYAEKIDGTIFVLPAKKADELGDIELTLDEQDRIAAYQVNWSLLDEKIPDDSEMVELLEAFKQAEQGLHAPPTRINK